MRIKFKNENPIFTRQPALLLHSDSVQTFAVIFYVMLSLIRLMHNGFHITNTLYVILTFLSLMLIFISGYISEYYRAVLWDFCWLLIALLITFHRNMEYRLDVTIMCLMAVGFYLLYPTMKISMLDSIRQSFLLITAFSVLSAVITWISLFYYKFYLLIIEQFYSPETLEKITQHYRRGMLDGLSTHYSYNAYYILSGLMICTAWIFYHMQDNVKSSHSERKLSRNIYIIVYVFLFLTLLAIGKRGHLIFMMAAVAVTYTRLHMRISKRILFIFILTIAAIIFIPVAFEYLPQTQLFFQRMFTGVGDSDYLSGRESLYAIALDMFREHPFFGNGFGSFSVFVRNANPGAHNDYLQFLCEWGITGFIVCIIAYFGVLFQTWKLTKNAELMCHPKTGICLIWSLLFQLYVCFQSLSGLPHYDFEIFMIYCIACAVPGIIVNNNYRRKRYSQR